MIHRSVDKKTDRTLGYNKDGNGAEINLSAPFLSCGCRKSRLCDVIGWGRGSEEFDEGSRWAESLLKGKCRAELWGVFTSSCVKDCRQKAIIAFTYVPQTKCVFILNLQQFHFLLFYYFCLSLCKSLVHSFSDNPKSRLIMVGFC